MSNRMCPVYRMYNVVPGISQRSESRSESHSVVSKVKDGPLLTCQKSLFVWYCLLFNAVLFTLWSIFEGETAQQQYQFEPSKIISDPIFW